MLRIQNGELVLSCDGISCIGNKCKYWRSIEQGVVSSFTSGDHHCAISIEFGKYFKSFPMAENRWALMGWTGIGKRILKDYPSLVHFAEGRKEC